MADGVRKIWNSESKKNPTTRKSSRRAAVRVDSAANKPAGQVALSNEDVARRAYEIWLSKGCEQGHDLDHWIEAERQLRQQASKT